MGNIASAAIASKGISKEYWECLIKYVKCHPEYWSLNGKPILEYPLQVPLGVSMYEFLKDLFEKYHRLLNQNIQEALNDVKIIDSIRKITKRISNTILSALRLYYKGNVVKAYSVFAEMMKDIDQNYIPEKNVEYGQRFYRMRTELNKTDVKDFYHLPTSLRYKSGTMRFSISGYPCFYIGYSKNVCQKEISQKGSIISLSLKKGIRLKVFDLTFGKDQLENQEKVGAFMAVFPLISACYIKMDEEISRNAKFQEEYIIPQMLTSYLRNKTNYDGVCYFSVRNENLEPNGREENDYRNLALFTNVYIEDSIQGLIEDEMSKDFADCYMINCNKKNKEYDFILMNNFEWYKPFNL